MTETNLQLGGGYTYQWECAILLALNCFYDPVAYSKTLFNLISGFLGEVAEIHLEGKDGASGPALEDITLKKGNRRILIQVKAKQTEGKRWTPTDPLLLGTLYRFCTIHQGTENPDDVRFVFLTNGPLNPDLVTVKQAAGTNAVEHCIEVDELYRYLARYADRERHDRPDSAQFREVLVRTSLVTYLPVDSVKANIQAKLKALGRQDWQEAHAVLFEYFARQSTRIGGARETGRTVAQALGVTLDPWAHDTGRRLLLRPDPSPFQAPPLPPHFVPRPKVTTSVKRQLLNEAPDAAGVLVVSAIHGLGGIGKSTLAAALAHDHDVRRQFPDGILWVTLGQQPDLLPLLSDWIRSLGDRTFHPSTTSMASTHLRTLLQDRAVLLVVDDIWDPSHASLFRVGDARCRLLITTRDAVIAKMLGAELYDLGVLTEQQSLALLIARLGRRIDESEARSALELAKAVGHLPLALELAAAQVQDGVGWADLLSDLKAEIARLEVLDLPGANEVTDEAVRKRLSLRASFHLSVRRLTATRRDMFAWLGVLPEDTALIPNVTATLWETDERDARVTLRYLRDKALLLRGGPLPDGTPTYRLHDLLHDLARRLLTSSRSPQSDVDLPGLGLTLPEAHRAFLDRYRAHPDRKRWDTIPPDGYIQAHLTWHMEQAGLAEEIHALLRTSSREGRNCWYQTRDRLGQTAGYLEDIARAWRLAESPSARTGPRLGLQARYALITSSLRSLAKNIPPALLIGLVRAKVWAPSQGLAYARQAPEADQRVETLTGIVDHLPENLRRDVLGEAIASARQVRDPTARADLLVALLPHSASELQRRILQEIMRATQAISYRRHREEVLSRVAPRLMDLHYREWALDAALSIEDARTFAEVLTRLVPHLSEQMLARVLSSAEGKASEWQSRALATVARFLPDSLLPRALDVLQHIEEIRPRVESLHDLAPHLPDTLLSETLKRIRMAQNTEWQMNALAQLAPHLSGRLLLDAVETAQAIKDEGDRTRALAELRPRLPQVSPTSVQNGRRREPTGEEASGDEGWRQVLRSQVEFVRQSRDGASLTEFLANTPRHLASPSVDDLIHMARVMTDGEARVDTLLGVLPYLTGSRKEGILRDAVATVRGIRNQGRRAAVLLRLAPVLPELLRRQALQLAEATCDEKHRARILPALVEGMSVGFQDEVLVASASFKDADCWVRAMTVLIPQLGPRLRRRALLDSLDIVLAKRGGTWRAKALIQLAPHLPEVMTRETLDRVTESLDAIDDEGWRAKALVEMARQLPSSFGQDTMRKALEATQQIGSESVRVATLVDLVPILPRQLLQEALSTVLAIGDVEERIDSTVGLVPYLPERLAGGALAAVHGHKNETRQAKLLVALIPHLPSPMLVEAVAVCEQMTSDRNRLRVVVHLVSRLPESLQERALGILERASSGSRVGDALRGIVPHLPTQFLDRVVSIARGIDSDLERVQALAGLVPNLPDPFRTQALDQALAEVSLVASDRRRLELLAKMAPYVSQPEHLHTLQRVAQSLQVAPSRDVEWRCLGQLASRMPGILQPTPMDLVEAMTPNKPRAEALKELAPYLSREELHRALQLARKIRSGTSRVSGLTALSCHLSQGARESVLSETLAIARGLPNRRNRVLAVAKVAPLLPGPQREIVLREVLEELRQPGAPKWRFNVLVQLAETATPQTSYAMLHKAAEVAAKIEDPDERAGALVHLAGSMPPPLYEAGVESALPAVLGVRGADRRAELLDKLSSHIVALPTTSIDTMWRKAAHTLSTHTRRELALALPALGLVLAKLGDEEDIEEVCRAVQDVARWWP